MDCKQTGYSHLKYGVTMGSINFTISEEQRKEYASGFVLDLILNQGFHFNVILDGPDKDLEPIFVHMMTQEYIDLDSRQNYTPTAKGIEKLSNMKKKYEEYLAHFDIFCAVDLENGTFAFEKIFDLDDAEWDEYINRESFVDLRIAVAWFKKVDPCDFVFLSFLKEGQFSTESDGWQFDLLSGLTWGQVEEIIDSAIQIEELAYETEHGEPISGEAVIEDVIKQGAALNNKLHKREEEHRHESNPFPNDYSTDDEETYVVTNYESYYNPFYISPIWFLF